MKITVKRFDKTIPLPIYNRRAACFDLKCRETVVISPHEVKPIRQNVAMQVPDGHALLLFSRSSTPITKGLILANGVGVSDPYRDGDNDEQIAYFLNVTDKPVMVEAGDRLVQGMIIKSEAVEWSELDILNSNRNG
jgi:dUTP pyrophosphatase